MYFWINLIRLGFCLEPAKIKYMRKWSLNEKWNWQESLILKHGAAVPGGMDVDWGVRRAWGSQRAAWRPWSHIWQEFTKRWEVSQDKQHALCSGEGPWWWYTFWYITGCTPITVILFVRFRRYRVLWGQLKVMGLYLGVCWVLCPTGFACNLKYIIVITTIGLITLIMVLADLRFLTPNFVSIPYAMFHMGLVKCRLDVSELKQAYSAVEHHISSFFRRL